MPDIGSFAAAMSSLQAASNIANAIIDLRDGQLIQTKVIELQREILSAQQNAISAQSDQLTLLNRISNLEEKVAELESWESEKQKYKLNRRDNGSLTYVLKEGMETTEPDHEICASCYARSFKSLLQAQSWQPGACKVLCCHECGSVVYVKGFPQAEHEKLRPKPRH